jgi:hypothetical protein
MLRWRTITALCAALLLSLAAPTAALAQEEPDVISSPTIVSAVVDTKTGVATVTVSVTCLMDVPAPGAVFGLAALSQSYGSGNFAYSQQHFGWNTCQAGEVLTLSVRFPSWLVGSRFLPGPAEIDGWIEARFVGAEDTESIGPTTVILRPA